MNPSEYFTYLFYSWEARGRGWYLFDQAVSLEPPFIPFVRYFPRSGYIDESKRPTIISSFIDAIKGKKHPKYSDEQIMDYESIEPFIYSAPLEIKTLQIKLPKQRKINFENMRALLMMLSNTQFNVSFELFGNKSEIIIQFVCGSLDLQIVRTYIKSYFPELAIIENNKFIEILPKDTQTHIVEFGLKEEFVRPISILKNNTIDPLTSIIGILENLQDYEFGGIQILFQAAVNRWSQSILHSVTLGDGKSFFQDVPDAPKIAQEKVSSPLFGVSIKAFSQEKSGSQTIIENLTHAVTQASKGMYNELMPLLDHTTSERYKIEDVYLRESHRIGMLLSTDELVTLLHFPSETIVSKKLLQSLRKTVEVPAIAKGKETILGQNTHNSILTHVSYGIDDKLKHTHIIGATGTGKSTLLAQQLLQDIEQGIGIALFDPHGDLVDDVVARLPVSSLEKIVIIDPADTDFPIGLNILHAHNDLEREVLSSDLVAAFRKLSTSWGDQMNTVFANAILAILESKEGGTLNDLRRFLVEPQFRNTFLKTITDPSILYYWYKEYPLLKTNSIGPILTRLDTFLRPKIIRNMVSQKTGLDFEEILNEKKILFVKLPQGLIGKENSFLLGSLILSKLHQAAFARQAKQVRPPFMIYLDEFHNFITPSIKEMLSGVRKYNVGLILSHQDLQQLQREDTELLNSVLGNTYTRIVFRVGEPDAKKLQDGFADFDFTDMQNLGRGEAIIRVEQPKYNTSFETKALSHVNAQNKEELYRIALSVSRAKYSKSKEEIEKEIQSSLQFTQEGNVLKEETKTEKKTFIEEEKNPIKKEAIIEIPKKAEALPIETITIEGAPIVNEEKKQISTHRYLQELIKRFGESTGHIATIEAGILGATGSIDVLLEKQGKKIAIEISVTTDASWEVHNLKKCVDSGADTIFSVSGDPKHLRVIESTFKETYGKSGNNIFFVTPDVLFTHLQDKGDTQFPDTGNIEKGYRVNVSYSNEASISSKHSKETIAQVLLKSLKKKT